MLVALILCPVSLRWIVHRSRANSSKLQVQMETYKEWLGSYCKLMVSTNIFGLSSAEKCALKKRYDASVKLFLRCNNLVKERLNDSTWVTRWLGSVAFLFICMWSANELIHARATGNDDAFTAGDLVLLLSIYLNFRKHLSKVNDGFVHFHRAAV